MIPVMVINNESHINGLPKIDFVRTYQHRKNKVTADKVLKNWRQYDYIAHDDIGLFSWNFFDELFDYTNFYYMTSYPSEFYSTSIGPAAIYTDIIDGVYVAKSPVLGRQQLLDLAAKRISVLKDNLNVRLSFENTAFRKDNDAYRYITEPDFITSLVNDNNVGFTLDIAHAEITRRAKGYDSAYSYLEALPLDKCIEIHLSTPYGVDDSHELPNSLIMELFRWIKSQIRQNVYVVVEYYKNMDSLKYFYENVLVRYL